MSDNLSNHVLAGVDGSSADAIENIMTAHERYLRVVVRRRFPHWLRSKCDSADIVQSVWARMLPRLRAGQVRFQTSDELKAFLAASARNRLTDRIRHHRAAERREQMQSLARSSKPIQPGARPSQVAQAHELWERLIAFCPPEHRDIVRLRAQGLSLDAIAAHTGLHEGSIRRILRRLARDVAFADETVSP